MRVFARKGQRSAALAQYERCRRVLAHDLGLEPAPETIALYNRIRAGALERSFSALSVDKALITNVCTN
jgi:DNA-binding SARP family transcriptional activator